MSGSTCLRDQRCSSKAATEFPWELRDAVDPDLKEGIGTVVDLCYARVHKHDLEVREFEVARGSFSGDN